MTPTLYVQYSTYWLSFFTGLTGYSTSVLLPFFTATTQTHESLKRILSDFYSTNHSALFCLKSPHEFFFLNQSQWAIAVGEPIIVTSVLLFLALDTWRRVLAQPRSTPASLLACLKLQQPSRPACRSQGDCKRKRRVFSICNCRLQLFIWLPRLIQCSSKRKTKTWSYLWKRQG